VVGVEPELAADARESLQTGRRVSWQPDQTHRTIADGLRTVSLGELPWEHVRTGATCSPCQPELWRSRVAETPTLNSWLKCSPTERPTLKSPTRINKAAIARPERNAPGPDQRLSAYTPQRSFPRGSCAPRGKLRPTERL
jgi:hypothetical protein